MRVILADDVGGLWHRGDTPGYAQTWEEGHLYGSVTATEIANALSALGIEVDRRRVELAEPIRGLGSHTVHVRLHRDVVATLTIDVQALGAPA